MAETLGTATLELEGDLSKLEKDLAKARTAASAEGQKASAGFGARFAGGVKKATLPAIAALGAVAVGAKKVTDAASDLGESQNAVNVVFGDSADKLHAFAEVAAQEAGLSMRAFNELVTPIGAALINTGMAADEAADASINLAKRAADMASVFNVDVTEAMAAIQAGLRGEMDPLERFGVGLSDAAITAYALEEGMVAAGEELTNQQKVQARLGLLMKQTNRVAGDFKNTSDELANSQRIAAAEAENHQANLGRGLLPVMKTLTGIGRELLGVLGAHTTAVTAVTIAVAGLAAGVLVINGALKVYRAGVVAATAAQWLWNAALAANPIVLVIAALVALGVALVVAYKKSETFRRVVSASIDFVKRHWQLLLLALGPFGVAIGLVIKHFGTLREKGVAALDRIKAVVNTVRGAFVSAFNAMQGPVIRVISWVRTLVEAIQGAIAWVNNLRSKVGQALPDPTPGFDVPGVPIFDDGGVMPGPHGVHRLALVAGGETILPTHKRGFGGTGGVTIVNRGIIASEREAVAWIKKAHDDYRRQNGGRAPW